APAQHLASGGEVHTDQSPSSEGRGAGGDLAVQLCHGGDLDDSSTGVLHTTQPKARGRSASEGMGQEVGEEVLLVDLEAACTEPPAHVGAVAKEEVQALRVADQVHHLRQVD